MRATARELEQIAARVAHVSFAIACVFYVAGTAALLWCVAALGGDDGTLDTAACFAWLVMGVAAAQIFLRLEAWMLAPLNRHNAEARLKDRTFQRMLEAVRKPEGSLA